MSEIAIHDAPALRVRGDCLIRADLSEHRMSGQSEQLWAKRHGHRVFELCCIPFFTYGLALHDLVETDDTLTIRRRVQSRGHRVLRVAVVDKNEANALHELIHGWVHQTGLPYEFRAEGYGYLAVDLPPDRADVSFVREMKSRFREGSIIEEFGA